MRAIASSTTFGMHEPQLPVGFNELVVAVRRVPDELVRAHQAVEAVPVDRAGGHPFGFVNQQAGQPPFALQQLPQVTPAAPRS